MTDRDEREELAEERTEWADQRTFLARQRTLASWLRTSLACMAVGIGVTEFVTEVEPQWIISALGGVCGHRRGDFGAVVRELSAGADPE